jgi:N-formylglutamate amidohydrolase
MSAVPNSYVKTPKKYFNGGYITEKYKSYPNTVVVQIEIPANIRKNKELRKDFSRKTAKIIKYYYNIINNSLNHEKI